MPLSKLQSNGDAWAGGVTAVVMAGAGVYGEFGVEAAGGVIGQYESVIDISSMAMSPL